MSQPSRDPYAILQTEFEMFGEHADDDWFSNLPSLSDLFGEDDEDDDGGGALTTLWKWEDDAAAVLMLFRAADAAVGLDQCHAEALPRRSPQLRAAAESAAGQLKTAAQRSAFWRAVVLQRHA